MPGEIDPTSDPPTDALTVGIPGGLSMAALGEAAATRRDLTKRPRATMRTSATTTENNPASSMWVVPAEGRTILDINGVAYPAEGMEVSIDDAYAHRRLRDGSLLLGVPTGTSLEMHAQESAVDTFAAAGTLAAP